jgi:glycosyltransferase involved in cell wall biosynthesis
MSSSVKKKSICMLYTFEHVKHVIIRRQITSLLQDDLIITIIDRGHECISNSINYQHINLGRRELVFLKKWVWKFLRPFAPGKYGTMYWTLIKIYEEWLGSLDLAREARDLDADIIQAHDLWACYAAVKSAKYKKRSVIYDAHEMASEQGDPKSYYNRFLKWLENITIPKADYVILPNEARSVLYQQEYRLKHEPIVIHNYPPKHDIVRSRNISDHFGLGGEVKVVLYHGALMEGRALENLMLAAKFLNPDVVLVIIGEQNEYYEKKLLPIYLSERLEKKIYFIDYVEPEKIHNYVASATVGVVIYKNINLNNFLCAPTKLYEFIMFGIPVVACNFPVIEEIYHDYPIGFLFDPDDIHSIAEAIHKTLEFTKEEWEKRFLKLPRSINLFTWEEEIKKLLTLYRQFE